MGDLLSDGLSLWTLCFMPSLHWLCTSENGLARLWSFLHERGAGDVSASLVVAVTLVVAFALSPLLLVVTTYLMARELRLRRRLLREHQEVLFEPIDSDKLPTALHRKFDLLGSDVESVGYQLLGDYLMKREPAGYYGRVLQSCDGQVVCCIMRLFGSLQCGFISLLGDGRVLETSSFAGCSELSWVLGHERYRGVFAGDIPIDKIEELHREELQKFAAETGDAVLGFEANQVGDVLRYEHRLFSQLEHERGKSNQPPEPVLPAGYPIACNELVGVQSDNYAMMS